MGVLGNLGVPELFGPGELTGLRYSGREGASPIGLYSALARGVSDMPMKASMAGGWKAAIKGLVNKGIVKADEIEWSGVNDWLDLQSGKVTKEQVQDYLRANGVQVAEVTLGRSEVDNPYQIVDDGDGYNVEAGGQRLFPDSMTYMEAEDAIEELREDDQAAEVDSTKYSQYTLPGGTNYREVLLTLPVLDDAKAKVELQWEKQNDGMLVATAPSGNLVTISYDETGASLQMLTPDAVDIGDEREFRTLQEAKDAAAKMVMGKRQNYTATYKSSHWDQPNVLAHIRLNDRTDADGKRVLFVEEIQSDWAADGRSKGFKGVFPNEVLQAAIKGGMSEDQARADIRALLKDPFGTDARPTGDKWQRLVDATASTGIDLNEVFHDRQDTGVPLAPFVGKTDAWVSLAIKRVIAMAAEGGYDRVAFVNGDQSAERYDLSKQVDRIDYDDKTGNLVVSDLNGRRPLTKSDIKPTDLPGIIGKEVADRLMANPDTSTGFKYTLQGNGLKLGGEGMKAFYDQIVPSVVKKLVGKLGGEMTTVHMGESSKYRAIMSDADGGGEVVDANGGTVSFHATVASARDEARRLSGGALGAVALEQPGFTITDAMREKAAGGLPMFSARQTDTPEFQRWFGDSKVVDAEGKPLVVYHGTTGDFSAFDRAQIKRKAAGTGFYFTTDKSQRGYAEGEGANVMPVYLSIQNPTDDPFLFRTDGTYDGLIFPLKSAPGVIHMAVREPTQIKSAIGNNGDFDSSNPDIRHSARSQLVDYLDKRNKTLHRVNTATTLQSDMNLAAKAIAAALQEIRKGNTDQMEVPVGPVPHVLHMLGAPMQMLQINASILRKVFVDKHADDMAAVTPEEFVRALYQPVAVMQMQSKSEFELLTSILNPDGQPVMLAVAFDSQVGPKTKVASIKSAYAKDALLRPGAMRALLQSGNVKYADLAAIVHLEKKSPVVAKAFDRAVPASGDPAASFGQADSHFPAQSNPDDFHTQDRPSINLGAASSMGSDRLGLSQASKFAKAVAQAINSRTLAGYGNLANFITENYKPGSSPKGWQDAPKFSAREGVWDAGDSTGLDDVIYKMQDKHIDTKRVIEAIRAADKQVGEDENSYLWKELFHGFALRHGL